MRARIAGIPVVTMVFLLALTGGTAAAAPCEVNNVRLTFFPAGEGAAGTLSDDFRLAIRRGRGQPDRCSVKGYPHIELLGKEGKELPIGIRRAATGKARRLSLAPGRRAWFQTRRRNPETSNCKFRRVYAISIHIPGQAKELVVKGFDPIRWCRAGTRVTRIKRNR